MNIILIFIKLYLSNYNLIEEIFMKLKIWIKKNYILTNNYKKFEEFLKIILYQIINKNNNYFKLYYIMI